MCKQLYSVAVLCQSTYFAWSLSTRDRFVVPIILKVRCPLLGGRITIIIKLISR